MPTRPPSRPSCSASPPPNRSESGVGSKLHQLPSEGGAALTSARSYPAIRDYPTSKGGRNA